MNTTTSYTNTKTGEDITEVIEFLKTQTRSTFANSLRSQFEGKGWLSEKQIAAAERMMSEKLIQETVEVAPKPKLPEIPSGHYAVPSVGKNDLDFFRVDRPDKGKWMGYTFVKRVIGGHPEFKVPFTQAKDVLARIEAAGVEAAATLYGREIGRCYKCNRTLTDETSRNLGIGPECRKGL